MDFADLEDFIKNKMRMTHIYQPLMIKTLLESGNTATTEQIARRFLNHDDPELNYYKKITKRWPHITLKKHGIVSYGKDRYTLLLGDVTRRQKERLIELCDLRLSEFIDKDPWIKKFRELDARAASGSIRYDTLARAKGRCAACGIERSRAAFHVDHIVPHSLGGKTVPGNLQALCSQCNQEKRNRDDTDFIRWEKRMQFRRKDCGLCDPGHQIMSNMLACAIYDVHREHAMSSLVMPKRHVGAFFEMIPSERNLCLELVRNVQSEIGSMDSSITGFRTSFDSDSRDHFRISVVPVRQ